MSPHDNMADDMTLLSVHVQVDLIEMLESLHATWAF